VLGLGACERGGTDPANNELGGGDGDAPVPVGREESATARAGIDGGTMDNARTASPGTTSLNDTGTTTGGGGSAITGGGTGGNTGTTAAGGTTGSGGRGGNGGSSATGGGQSGTSRSGTGNSTAGTASR
jgi:hypothetical protein